MCETLWPTIQLDCGTFLRAARVSWHVPHRIASVVSAAKNSQSFLCRRDHTIRLMLDPPPNSLPMSKGMEQPLRCGWVGPQCSSPARYQGSTVTDLLRLHSARHPGRRLPEAAR